MKYLIGGATGLLKEVDTSGKNVKTISDVTNQSIHKEITCMCWSGGYGGYMETELTVGLVDGSVISYTWPELRILRKYKLPSKCVYVGMLNAHVDVFYKDFCDKYDGSNLYPKYDGFWKNDRLLVCVSECGFLCLLDWDFEENVVHKSRCKQMSGSDADEALLERLSTDFCISIFKFKEPINAVAVNSLMKHRIVLGGGSNVPILFDVYGERILWKGKRPPPTLLDLPTPFNITCITILEHISVDLIAVATKDSRIYLYDMMAQHEPVFDWNVCDVRGFNFSAMAMAYNHVRDYNSSRRKELKSSKAANYTAENRNLTCAVAATSLKLDVKYTATCCKSKSDQCSLYIGDNVGSIYHFKVITGDRLIEIISQKVKRFKKNPDAECKPKELLDLLINARRKFGSANQNDMPINYARNGDKQYIVRLVGTFPIHRGAIMHLSLYGKRLISASLDRYTRVYKINSKTTRVEIFCKQMQTRLLPCTDVFNAHKTENEDSDSCTHDTDEDSSSAQGDEDSQSVQDDDDSRSNDDAQSIQDSLDGDSGAESKVF
ncbi:bifunctional WD40-repeat-containing domain superfamily/WD40-YVTN repeat-like-containing domain superfamily/WDR74-Nsa1 [Babesia duncani]|uniref:Bifunctional WD40-repeat-containing domain superfamily/WD40-YVTN repeat-like-containing domain superfamily/WDR74-Nsa1 n=1 Tax=Babesia duncani TaxID=323732 RepID=A0AAD9PNT7_9APIC|nr:bifunctional WD40-repeat-containing domain superfamily/WD40-YVTN repeat-like-containing domain superfamily/WDR74-Nsa1 [Babesia duncani]